MALPDFAAAEALSPVSPSGVGPGGPVATGAPSPAAIEVPLSRGQRALWFLHRLAPDSPAYILAGAFKIRGPLDVPALRRVFEDLADRHPALRTLFSDDSGAANALSQRVLAQRSPSFFEQDAGTWDEVTLEARQAELAWSPFDLERDPLLRVGVLHRGPDEHRVVVAFHHIVADFWSLGVLLGELSVLYRRAGEADTLRATLPPLRSTYAEHVRRQESRLAGPDGERLWEFWRRELAGPLPVLELPADRPRPSSPRFVGGAASVRLAPELGRRLRAAGRRRGATLFTTLLAGYEILLTRESGQEELIVGAPTAGRESPALAGLVGYFVNPVALRADLRGDPTGALLLSRTRERVLAAFRHQEMPFPLLAERLQPERDPARSPIFQAVFVLHKSHGSGARTIPGLAGFALGEPGAAIDLGGLPVESIALADRGAPFDLTLTMAEEGGALWASLVYSAELFDLATVERMGNRLAALLGGLLADPERPISELPGWSALEAAQASAELPEEADYVAPQTAVEEVLAEIWRETLGVDRVGIHDGFLALGGGRRERDRMLARVRKVFQVALPGDTLGDSPTVAGLAQAIAGELLAGADEATRAEILTELE